jgi:transcriptional regulator with XRE-family HTH domain
MTGKEVIYIRESLGLGRGDFSDLLGVTSSTTIRWEKLGVKQIKVNPFQEKLLNYLQAKILYRNQKELNKLKKGISESLILGGTLMALGHVLNDLLNQSHT